VIEEKKMAKKILLVDDIESVRMLIKLILKNVSYDIEEAKDGLEAYSKCTNGSLPDLILMDILMPKMDGIECCRRLKKSAATKSIPIIMVTTRGENENIQNAFAAGCNDYITKPISKIELITKIRQLIGE